MDKQGMERLKQSLRDAYIQLKDLHHKSLIDMSQIEKNDRRIFYFKPESILLKDPEVQKGYREKLIKAIGQVPPNLRELPSMAEDFNKELQQVLMD
mmetsp:Transcript_741/g.799  ORF Transcript_741/g.799 Transcript_741/m.799 type:complete len:96 (-) Transcript_741:106-393(-)